MREILLALFLASFLFFIPSASAQLNFTGIDGYRAPEGMEMLVGDARVNIYDYRFAELGSIVISNGTVVSTGQNLTGNPTHKIYVRDAAVLQKIFDSGSVKEFNLQRSVHAIRIEALDFPGQLRLAIGTLLASIASLFIAP
ncbi:MAG: hypothetical protein HY833_00080 [Candidatus Aenigmarchaeota archaeon]|nr:hypothetical protein [Candidatus Aenigmarchaeota archaeon]